MKVELMRWDAAKYLKDEKTVASFLAGSWLDSIEDDDPDLFVGALAVAARALGIAQLAKNTGLDRQRLYDALTPGKETPYVTIAAIMRGLGVRFDVKPVEAPKAKRRARKATATV